MLIIRFEDEKHASDTLYYLHVLHYFRVCDQS